MAQQVFTAEQAERGAGLYAQQCAMCHGADLDGGAAGAPSLKGVDVMGNWGTAWSIYEYFSKAMPPQAPGQLGEAAYVDIMAHVLAANGAEAGATPLSGDQAALQAINLAAITSAAASPAPAPAAAPAAGGPGTLSFEGPTPQAFTFGKDLPVAPPPPPVAPAPQAAAPAPAPAPAAPAPAAPGTLSFEGPTPQAFTFGKDLPTAQ